MKDLLNVLAYSRMKSYGHQQRKLQEPDLCEDLWSKREASEKPLSQAVNMSL